MPGTPTTRLSLVQPIGADPPSELRVAATANAVTLDNAAMYIEGTLAARGAANSRPNGTLYRSTDSGAFSWTNGTLWIDLVQLTGGAGGITGSQISPTAGITSGQLDVSARRETYRSVNGVATAAAGDWIVATGGSNVTLPSVAVANTRVVIQANGAVTGGNPVTVAGTSIYGVGLSAAASFTIGTAEAAVALQSDGTNWQIISGQQDTGWVPLSLAGHITAGTSYTPAARLQGDTVRLRGTAVGDGSATTAIGTIPAGLRPAQQVGMMLPVLAGGAYEAYISAAGAITCSVTMVSASVLLDSGIYALS